MGRFYVRHGQAEAGLPLLERAATLAPDDAAIASTLARAVVDVLRLAGPFASDDRPGIARAKEILRQAAELDPDDAYVTAMRGFVEHLEGARLDLAQRYLEQATIQAPSREE